MDYKSLYRTFAILSFFITLGTYLFTVQPTVPFWDCGEFTSASIWQQVPHPPGAPLFLMVGKVFQTIIPFGDWGWRVNLVSVFSTAFTILLLYLITVKVIQNFRGKPVETLTDALSVYGSAFVGAMAFCFSDTLWFNGVESEVYAASTLFTAIVVYLMMRWNEEAENPGNERYLLLIAYLIGLSTGVHLLAILAIFSIVLLVYFKKYKFTIGSFILTGVISVIIFGIIYPGIVKYVPALLGGHLPFKNEAGEYLVEGGFVTILSIAFIIFAMYLFWYGYKRSKTIISLASLAFLLMIFGYTTYTHILLRSNANPPMNENEPKNFQTLTSYLGREQYGEQRMWPRRTDFNDDLKIYYYNKKDANGNFVYGQWMPPESKRAERKDGSSVSVPDFRNVNVGGELAYLFKYQIDHMYLRYFFWNFVGRESDVQDAQEAWFNKGESDIMNYKSGYANLFPIKFFALPLLLGLIGAFFHFKKDPRMAFIYLIMFLMMGVLATISQNQQQPQPRERDYFYTGSFLFFAMWIGMGAYGLIQIIQKDKPKQLVTAIILIGSFILVPVNMAFGGWKMHSRAGNYIPFDYSYNILQSTEKDAILFTNGDNDTFPLWYLQDVAGVRRDVRVVNLSLANTLWYVDQLKNRSPWGAKKIPLSFSDEILRLPESDERALSYDFGLPQEVTIPVKKEILANYTDDPQIINEGVMRFTFVGTPFTERDGQQIYLIHVSNKLVLDILKQTRFERPVYFSNTVGSDVFCGLGRFLRYEGMALRICPVQANLSKTGAIDVDRMGKCLLNINNSNDYHTEPHYGFKLRNLNNRDVYYDEVHRRLMTHYRQLYMTYSAFCLERLKDNKKAIAAMDTLDKYISTEQFPMNYDEEVQIAMLFDEAGRKEKAKKYAEMCLKSCQEIFNNSLLRGGRVENEIDEIKGKHGPYKSAAEAYMILENYAEARSILMKLYDMSKEVFNNIRNYPDYQQEAQGVSKNISDILGNILSIDRDEIQAIKEKKGIDAAIQAASNIKQKYGQSKDDHIKTLEPYIDQIIQSISGKTDTTAKL